MTKPLSPAAQAVVDAWDAKLNPDDYGLTYLTHDPEREALAAALRAAADQVAPSKQNYDEAPHELAAVCLSGMAYAAYELRAIAAELKGLTDDARRPKAPSLKEQAYDALDTYIYGEPDPMDKERTYNTIRRALEALPE